MDLEEELLSSLSELKKERKKNKQLKEELSKIKEIIQDLEETKKAFMDLQVKLKEVKRIEETLRTQLEEKERIQVELENEIVSLRRKLQDKDIKQNFDKRTKKLDQIISNQRPVYDKSGLRYNQNNPKMGSSSKVTKKEEAM